ncbi:MAG: Trm112 family protein [Deltaproteobacteria bacterium]|nr:Trm112 family protein [Deltaproteobacteria bacterium]
MPLDPDLIRILRCPKCKGELELKKDESAFICHGCKLTYPVVDEIPNFLVSEAQPLQK